MSHDVTILAAAGSTTTTLVPGDGGLTSHGPTLLAQRFLIELMTDLDSALALPGRGTSWPASLRRRLFATEYDVLVAAAAAIHTATINIRGEEQPSDDPASRLRSAQVQRLTLLPGALVLSVTIRPQSGPAVTVTFPVRVNY